MGRNTLTDDSIESIVWELAIFLENEFGFKLEESGSLTKDFDRLETKMYSLLEKYSNGYKNYN
jgi:hypothetical protein